MNRNFVFTTPVVESSLVVLAPVPKKRAEPSFANQFWNFLRVSFLFKTVLAKPAMSILITYSSCLHPQQSTFW